MAETVSSQVEAAPEPVPSGAVCVFSSGFFTRPDLARRMAAAGCAPRLGWPGPGRPVAVWGQRRRALIGRVLAGFCRADLVTVEEGWLDPAPPVPLHRRPAPMSLILDDLGVHYDAARPSRVERLIGTDAGAGLTVRARAGIAMLRDLRLSRRPGPVGDAAETPGSGNGARHGAGQGSGHVLVLDQLRGDASLRACDADRALFRRMLDAARTEHPGRPLIVKAHPDTARLGRPGHLCQGDLREGERLIGAPLNPWPLIEGAEAVYSVSSQAGYEAVLAGRAVRVFGTPFYAGWGLTQDETPIPRRGAGPTVETLFAAAHLLAPVYFDPWGQGPVPFEEAATAAAQAQQLWQEGPRPEMGPLPGRTVCGGFGRGKRRVLAGLCPAEQTPAILRDPGAALTRARATGARLWLWAGRSDWQQLDAARAAGLEAGFAEDGFLRSVGLGAALVPPCSLVFDDLGIHFDATRESRLERLIAGSVTLRAPERARAAALRARICAAGLTKYNLAGCGPHVPPDRPVVLVAGQVANDAALLRSDALTHDMEQMLRLAREAHPHAWIVYRPHPDVEAGLRPGALAARTVLGLADQIAGRSDAAAMMDRADAIWTVSSLLGFEALLRGRPVTCLGTPFYAGWGLTRDLGPVCARRQARPDLDGLTWAALIAYPAYRDPLTGLPCPPEVVAERLAAARAQKGMGTPR